MSIPQKLAGLSMSIDMIVCLFVAVHREPNSSSSVKIIIRKSPIRLFVALFVLFRFRDSRFVLKPLTDRLSHRNNERTKNDKSSSSWSTAERRRQLHPASPPRRRFTEFGENQEKQVLFAMRIQRTCEESVQIVDRSIERDCIAEEHIIT